jgi:hypothetical protein
MTLDNEKMRQERLADGERLRRLEEERDQMKRELERIASALAEGSDKKR